MSDVVYDDEPAAEEEYGSAADEVYEDQPSLSSDQFFGPPEELTFEQAAIEQANADAAQRARAGETPSGFDYTSNPDAKVSDVLAARDEASRAEAEQDAEWQRTYAEFEQEFADEEQEAARQEYEQGRAQVDQRYHEDVRQWLLQQTPQMQQQTLAWATQQQLEAEREADQWRALDERAARRDEPILQALERLEAADEAERQDEIAARIDNTWAQMGVPSDQFATAHQLSDLLIQELAAQGYELTPAVGELVLQRVGEHVAQFGGRVVWREDKGGNVVAKAAREFRPQDFPMLTMPEAAARPSAASRFFGGR